jgi:hypothetical protein
MATAPYAHFSVLGTWYPVPGTVCAACGSHNQILVEPLVVKWEPSSNVVGDFSWDGPFGYVFIIRENVETFLRSHKCDVACASVKYVETESALVDGERVAVPQQRDKLRWACCNTRIKLEMEASNVFVKVQCELCGTRTYTFRRDGIVIKGGEWHGEMMFRIVTNGKSQATFVTEEGMHLLRSARFTNISFTHAGEIRI